MILKQIPRLSFVFVIMIRFLCKFNYKIGAGNYSANSHAIAIHA